MIGSVTRTSECITAVIVLASASDGKANAAPSASARARREAIVGRLQRGIWNILTLRDVKPVHPTMCCACGALFGRANMLLLHEIRDLHHAQRASIGFCPIALRRLVP